MVKVRIEARAGLVPTKEEIDAFRLLGDVDLDGVIDIVDMKLIAKAFGSSDARYDLNGDGVVNIADLSIAGRNYGKSIIGQRSVESVVEVNSETFITPCVVELPAGTHILKCTLKYMNAEVAQIKTVELAETDAEAFVGFYFGIEAPSAYILLPVALGIAGGFLVAYTR